MVATHSLRPSFNNNLETIYLNNSVELEDSKSVLSNYKIADSSNVNAYITDNKLHISATAIGDAEDQFLRRNKLNGGTVSTELDFYDDHFDSVMEMKTRSFQYASVVKLLESEDAFAVVVKTEPDSKGSPRAMCGFPKDALEQGSIDELRAFLLERCTNMRRKKVKKF